MSNEELPEWLRPGIWVRNKLSPQMGRAFVMFVDEESCKGGFKYHLATPWKTHVRNDGWYTGGTVYPSGVDHWEPCEAAAALSAQPAQGPIEPWMEELLQDWERRDRPIDSTYAALHVRRILRMRKP